VERQTFEAQPYIVAHCCSISLIIGRPPPEPELPATIRETISPCNIFKHIPVQNRHKDVRRTVPRYLDAGLINSKPRHEGLFDVAWACVRPVPSYPDNQAARFKELDYVSDLWSELEVANIKVGTVGQVEMSHGSHWGRVRDRRGRWWGGAGRVEQAQRRVAKGGGWGKA
jgi:hypothetical protein